MKTTEVLQYYTQKSARLPIEQECDLAERWQQQSDFRARNKLVEANMGLVFSTAKRLVGNDVSKDLIHEGILGMMHATDLFDPTLGKAFAVFAWHWIRAYMSIYLSANRSITSGGIRGSHIFSMSKIRRSVLAQTGCEQTAVATVVTELGRDEGSVRAWFQRIDQRDASLEMIRMPRSDIQGQDELLANAQLMELVRLELQRAIDKLSQRQQQVIWAILDAGEDEITLQAIGDRIGVSKQRVYELRKEAFGIIRRHMKQQRVVWSCQR